MAKSLSKSKKAISPILATLLLIVIAVAAITVTYAWIMTYMGGAGQQAGVMLSIDAVSWPSSTSVKLYVRNTGTSDATVSAVYMGTSSSNLTPVTFSPPNAPVNANGGTAELTINLTEPWVDNVRYYFKVVPTLGAPAEGSSVP
jgi:flagellin-like protein